MIEIKYNGKTAQAQVVDECPGCPWGALDFSTGLFDHFASEDLGVIYGSWEFVGGATTTQSTKPPSTHTKQTSVSTLTPTSTSAQTSATRTSSSSLEAPSTLASTTPTIEPVEGLEQLNFAFLALLGITVRAASP
ncbi:hypothetical protein B0H13DRAFT_32994 [Mycena leptocephala]|nr:hypothetical protein B0H13DRAFT_32994 [Mycena leptocephala]